jgi:hypothetical protein
MLELSQRLAVVSEPVKDLGQIAARNRLKGISSRYAVRSASRASSSRPCGASAIIPSER